jgi:hypothetical protein
MQEQLEKLKDQAFRAHVFFWGSGGERYFGPINPTGIIERTVEGKTTNYLILAEHAAAIHLGLGYEDFPPRTEAVVFADLDEGFEFLRLDLASKTLGGIGATDTPDGTIRDLIKPPKVRRGTWNLLYPDPKILFKELRALPADIDALCQIVQHGTRQHRDQRLEALNNLQDRLEELQEFLPELHERFNPLVGQAEDMAIEYYIAATLANLGDDDPNIVREVSFHLSIAKQDGGGIWDADHAEVIRCNAIRALSNVREPDTVILVKRCLEDESLAVRKSVIWALGALGQEDGRSDLESIRDQKAGEEARAAQVALELFGTASYDQIRARSKELEQPPSAASPITSLYIYRNGQQLGPYAFDEVKAWLAAGQLAASDLAHYEGASAWMPLSSVPGINAK